MSMYTPEIRAALWKRITDEDMEIRGEAFIGLAKRGDSGIVDVLIVELNRPYVGNFSVDAAGILGDTRLIPVLKQLAFNCPEDTKILDALDRCRSSHLNS